MIKEILKVGLGGVAGGLQGANTDSDVNQIGEALGSAIKKLKENKVEVKSDKEEDKGMSDENLKKGCSDENLKTLYPHMSEEMIRWFSEINPIKFRYTSEAQEMYGNDQKGVDNKEHIGVKAQELESNPITQGAVNTDDKGYKEVDTRHLAFADTAMISELCREVMSLKREIEILKGAING